MINYVSGDIFNSECDLLLNPVNCVGIMGAGLALHFKNKYPFMYLHYVKLCEAKRIQPGSLHVCPQKYNGKLIGLFPTKRHWRNPSHIEDISAGLDSLKAYLKEHKVSCAIPKLGCGLGGLQWEVIKSLIDNKLSALENRIDVYERVAS